MSASGYAAGRLFVGYRRRSPHVDFTKIERGGLVPGRHRYIEVVFSLSYHSGKTQKKHHSLADARSFAGGSPLQPPPFRRATPWRPVHTSATAGCIRHSLRSCLMHPASVSACTLPHYVALLHSKRCLPVATPPAGFFVGWRLLIPLPAVTSPRRDSPRGHRAPSGCGAI